MNQMKQSEKVLAVQEPGYTNIWSIQTPAGVTVARLTIGPDAGAWAKRIEEALNVPAASESGAKYGEKT